MVNKAYRLVMGFADDIVKRSDADSDGGVSHILLSWSKPGVAEGLHTMYVLPRSFLRQLTLLSPVSRDQTTLFSRFIPLCNDLASLLP